MKLRQNTVTGSKRLRAGLPKFWSNGNKTSTRHAEGTTNKCSDVAITFPPGKNLTIIAASFESGEYTEKTEVRHQGVLAEVSKISAE